MSEKIKQTIRKLLRQKEGEEKLGNQGAAESFAAKVQELLFKYKIELADVEGIEDEANNPIIVDTVLPTEWGEEWLPKRVATTEGLAHIIAKHFFCRGLAMLDNNCVLFVGRQSDTVIAKAVFCRVMRTGLNICETEIAQAILSFTDQLDRDNPHYQDYGEAYRQRLERDLWAFRGGNESYRYSFFAGFNQSIESRLEANKSRLLEDHTSGTTALVLKRAEKDVDDFLRDRVKPTNDPIEDAGHRLRQDAFFTGSRYGRDVDISPNASKNLKGYGGE